MQVMRRRARNRPKTWPVGPRWTHQDKPFILPNLSHQTTFLLLSGTLTFTIFLLGKYQRCVELCLILAKPGSPSPHFQVSPGS